MQINLRKKEREICVSDIISYCNPYVCKENYICMVIGNGSNYGILNLNTGLIVRTYDSLEEINKTNCIKLLAKSENAKLVLLEE